MWAALCCWRSWSKMVCTSPSRSCRDCRAWLCRPLLSLAPSINLGRQSSSFLWHFFLAINQYEGEWPKMPTPCIHTYPFSIYDLILSKCLPFMYISRFFTGCLNHCSESITQVVHIICKHQSIPILLPHTSIHYSDLYLVVLYLSLSYLHWYKQKS